MTWTTLLILVVAVALYVFSGKLVKTEGKKPTTAMYLAKKGINLVSIVLIVVGLNRSGFGTLYYIKNGLQADIQSQQMHEQENASRKISVYVKSHEDELVRWAPVLGNEKASKTIFVWTAPDCPFCRRVHGEFLKVLDTDKDVRIVIKNFPVHGLISDIPGRWTIAAKLQSNAKAAAFYEKIMANQYWGNDHNAKDLTGVITKNLSKYAKDSGLDVAKLQKDINGPEVAQEMAQVRDLAQQFQITGTPFLIVNGQAFPGAVPYEQIMSALR